MKKAIIITVFLFAYMGVASASVMLSLEAPKTVIEVCNSFSVDLVVSGVASNAVPAVGDFDIDILYDTTQMDFVSYTLGSFLGDPLFDSIDFSLGDPAATGAVDLAQVSLLSTPELAFLQPDSFTLATLVFHCTAPGISQIALDGSNPFSTYKVGDGDGAPFQVVLGGPLTITQTPEPAAVLLFGIGMLIGTGVLRKN